MAITKRMAYGLVYRPIRLRDADFVAGQDDDTSMSAGDVAEIAVCNVGTTGQTSNYLAVQIGQRAQSSFGDNLGNEPYVKLQAGMSDVADTVEWALAVRRQGDVGGGAPGDITGFLTHRNMDATDPRQRPINLGPQEPIAREGMRLQLLTRDQTTSHTVDLSESSFEIPAMGGQQ